MADLNENLLCVAAGKGNIKDAADLIAQGVNVNAHSENGNTPLHYAAAYGRTNAVKFLVRHGANINEKGRAGMTALHLAAEGNKAETAVALIELDADIFATNDAKKTPMQIAPFLKSTFWKMFIAVENKARQKGN